MGGLPRDSPSGRPSMAKQPGGTHAHELVQELLHIRSPPTAWTGRTVAGLGHQLSRVSPVRRYTVEDLIGRMLIGTVSKRWQANCQYCG